MTPVPACVTSAEAPGAVAQTEAPSCAPPSIEEEPLPTEDERLLVKEVQRREALGRSRGGLSTKIHLSADGKARPLSFVLSEGQRNESLFVEAVLDAVRVPRPGRGRPRKRPSRLRADKGYTHRRCRQTLRRRGIQAMIPERDDQIQARRKRGADGGRPVVFVAATYAGRNVVERCILRLKQFRRVATRYDKLADAYQATITFAAIMIWLK